MADGCFDLTIIPRLSPLVAARHLPSLYQGRLDAVAGVRRVRATTVRVDSPVPMELDGEPRAAGPAELQVLPRILQVRGGWLRPPHDVLG